jgi:thioredoxin reductase (NADPH)
MTEQASQIVVVGGGPAGYTAAIYAARAGLEPICIEGYGAGGQIVRSAALHNYPGFPDGVSGAELADRIRGQAVGFGARMVLSEVESVDLSRSPFRLETADGSYAAEALIVATGAQSRRLGLPSEDEYDGRGVCYCAICDGAFFAGRRVAVVGGGDAALEEAMALSHIAESVVLIHRRSAFRANATLRSAIAANPKVSVRTPYVVAEVLGTEEAGVTGVRVIQVDNGAVEEITIDGLFVAIGHEPNSAMFQKWLTVDEYGFILPEPGGTATNVPGVFAAGDVADPRYRQAVTAAATGAQAAIDAERWLIRRTGERAAQIRGALSTVV